MDGILYYGIINQLRENVNCENSVPDSKLDRLPSVIMVKVNILSIKLVNVVNKLLQLNFK